jgi:hypothetical protein
MEDVAEDAEQQIGLGTLLGSLGCRLSAIVRRISKVQALRSRQVGVGEL